MKNILYRLLLLLSCFSMGSGFSDENIPDEKPVVYLIPVRQAIMHPQLYLLRRGVKHAVDANADAIILLVDTPGGSVDIMRQMVNPIIDVGIPTYALVEKDAFSAGAIISLATDKIYMTPRSVIGDAMPVIMGNGGYESLGERESEKIESGMDAIVRSIAQAKGRDEMLMRAMVRRELEFTLEDGTVISPKGNILTLTNQEAEQLLPDGSHLLSEGTVADLDELLTVIGFADAEIIELLPSLADDVALLITKLSPILLGLAMLALYTEIQAPGIGWAGGTAAILFVIVVFGHKVAGLAGMEDLVFVAIGILLILLEIFVLPGFGIAGGAGIVLLCWGLIQTMTLRYQGNPGDLPAFSAVENLGPAIASLGIAIIGATLLAALLLKSMGDNNLFGKKLVLSSALHNEADDTLTHLRTLVGNQALVTTPLRPSGTVEINGNVYDANSEGDYVDPGCSVNILAVRNHSLVVRKSQETSA
ncbi:NfeD family protein [Kiritimatiellota bacterium B12222]|nr:NfeD family protein [Kiritimatiellota bacterium B12222]